MKVKYGYLFPIRVNPACSKSGCVIHKAIDNGPVLSKTDNVLDLQTCFDMCDANSNCKGAAYIKDRRSCYLKGGTELSWYRDSGTAYEESNVYFGSNDCSQFDMTSLY